MSRSSKSTYLCERCGLPLQVNGSGYRHAVNAVTTSRACPSPVPVLRGQRPLKTGMVLTVWRPAGVVTIDRRPFQQRFRPESYSSLVDTVTKVTRGGETAAYAMITSVVVPRDGSGVTLTMEIIDSAEGAAA
jgi:hypothetical protein